MAHPHRRGHLLPTLLLTLLLGGCSTGGGALDGAPPATVGETPQQPGGPSPTEGSGDIDGTPNEGALPEPSVPTASSRPDLESFLRDCEQGMREWRAAQVDYPSQLTFAAGGEESYVAAVDVRSTPAPPGSVVPGPSPTAEPAFVKCEIAARLTPLGKGLEVDNEEWVLRSFTPAGVIRWSWTVTAVGDSVDLRLELQPAVVGLDGRPLVSELSTEVSSFITTTRVEKGSMERLGDWWEANWGTVTLVATGVGVAILGLLGFGEDLAVRSRRVVVAWRGDEPSPSPDRGDEEDTGPVTDDRPT